MASNDGRPRRTAGRGLIMMVAMSLVMVVGVAFADDDVPPPEGDPEGTAESVALDDPDPALVEDEDIPPDGPVDTDDPDAGTDPPDPDLPEADPVEEDGSDDDQNGPGDEPVDGPGLTSEHALRVIETANEAARPALQQAMANYEQAMLRREAAHERRDAARLRGEGDLTADGERHNGQAGQAAPRRGPPDDVTPPRGAGPPARGGSGE